MSILACQLKVKNWLLSDTFTIENEKTLAENKELTFFGKVFNSNDEVIDGYTFQFVCSSELNELKPNEANLLDNHLFLRVNWQAEELSNLEKQIVTPGIKIGFSLLLKFEQYFLLAIKNGGSCQLTSLTKSLSLKSDNSG
jgi:hypothetical protein